MDNNSIKNNICKFRKQKNMTQEDIAEKIGVSRQSVAKWETGETVPDLDKCKTLAEIFEVSLDDLANYEPEDSLGMALPPKGKHLFGMVTVGDKGQIVIPKKAREITRKSDLTITNFFGKLSDCKSEGAFRKVKAFFPGRTFFQNRKTLSCL